MKQVQQKNLPPGRHFVDIDERAGKRFFQLSFIGTGTVTISVYVPGETGKLGEIVDTVVGLLPLDPASHVIDLSTKQAPVTMEGFVDAFVFEGTGMFSYVIHYQ